MIENISVDEALIRGKRMTTIPIIIISFIMTGVLISCIVLSLEHLVTYWTIPIAMLSLLVAPYLFWSVRITHWKLWAFENVRNVHELKKRAIQEMLIHKDGSFYNKTEIWTQSQREKWSILKEKFKQEDIFIDDLTIPPETFIFYSKFQSQFEIGSVILILLIGVILSIVVESYFVASLAGMFAIFAAYIVYTRLQRATNTEPQIIINDKGIKIIPIPFQDWSVIKNEVVITSGSSRYQRNYLIFDHPEGRVELNIDYLETKKSTLNKLLRIYRARHQHS
jgi:hypothetical protein